MVEVEKIEEEGDLVHKKRVTRTFRCSCGKEKTNTYWVLLE